MLPTIWAIRADVLPYLLERQAKSFLDEIIKEESEKEIGEICGNIGVVNVRGILMPSLDFEHLMCNFLPIFNIRNQIQDFLSDQRIEKIILSIDSPGGAIDGIFALAQLIRDSCQIKPIIAFVNECACSGAYWLAAACNAIYLASPTAQVGSVGVVVIHEDISKKLEMEGIKPTEIFAGKYKTFGSPYDALSKDESAYIQDQINKLYEVFLSDVARYRGKDLDYVRQNMADGKIFIGQDAITAGLADNIILKVENLLEVNGMGLFSGKKVVAPALGSSEMPEKKCELDENGNPIELDENGNPIKKNEKKDIPMIPMDKKEAAASTQEILAQERLRVSGIDEIAIEGMETLAKKAVADGWTVEKFALEQTKAAKDRGVSMTQIKQASANIPFSTGAKGGDVPEKQKIIDAMASGMNNKRGTPGKTASWK